jgi:hypothetical protein
MSLLSPAYNFDIIRGWPSDAAVEYDVAPGSGLTLQEGQFVVLSNNSGVPAAILPTAASIANDVLTAGQNPTPFWVVIEGNTSNEFDAIATGKVTLLKANQLLIQTTQFVNAGSLVPGAVLTVSDGANDDGSDPTGTAGQLTLRAGDAADLQIVGYVVENNVATQGTLTVMVVSR